jgi:hypothetical protein
MAKRKFTIVLIKPSHYDDDGYVIQWRRSTIPSNSLASVYGLLRECAEARVLGPDVEIGFEIYDECNTIVDFPAISKRILADSGMVALVGVQSNQFPRALDIGRQFRKQGVTVAVGGFHVSGCIAMLPELPPDLKEAQALGMILYAGEGENRLAEFLKDVDSGKPKPVYNYLNDMPDMAAAAIPVLPRPVVTKVAGHYTSFDAGRGCPFQCSFCTIINVQGRKSRYRTPDDVEAIVRANAAQGVTRFFVTDDNFARNRNWEPILDRLIELRENQGFRIRLLLQVDTLCHRIPGFIEKAARAGCNAVFIGLENINPASLMGAKKRQNKIWEYREMLQMWRRAKVMTWAGYILGFPTDTPESIARDIDTIKRELPIDILEFFFLTPLPGSEDHKKLLAKGVWMDPDINKYDLNHRVSHHPKMSDQEWEDAYRAAWSAFYTLDHIGTILRRAAAIKNGRPKQILSTMLWFKLMIDHEGVHPLEGGAFRLKFRRDRRAGLPIESRFIFYPRYGFEILSKAWKYGSFFLKTRKVLKAALEAPDRWTYSDLAIEAPKSDEFEQLSLYHATSGGEAALARKTLGDTIRDSAPAPAVAISATAAE